MAKYQDVEEQYLTEEKLARFAPKGTSKRAIKAIYEDIQRVREDENLIYSEVEERMLSNMHLLGKSGVTLAKVLDAVKWCTLQVHHTNRQCYELVFPGKVELLKEKYGHNGEQDIIDRIDRAAMSFNNSMTVTEIAKTIMVPLYIQMQPEVLKSAKALIGLRDGTDANGRPTSGQVQMQSALAIIDKFSIPEDMNINLNVTTDDATKSVQEMMLEQVRQNTLVQMKRLQMGEDIRTVQKLGLSADVIEVEVSDNE